MFWLAATFLTVQVVSRCIYPSSSHLRRSSMQRWLRNASCMGSRRATCAAVLSTFHSTRLISLRLQAKLESSEVLSAGEASHAVLPQCADAEVLASWLWTCCCLTCEGWRQCLRCSYTITWDCARWGEWACLGWDNDAGHVAFKPFTVSVDISALPFAFCRCRGAATWRKVDRCEWYDSNVFKC